MINDSVASDEFVSLDFPGLPRQFLSGVAPALAALALSALAGVWILQRLPDEAPAFVRAPTAASPTAASAPLVAANPYGALFDPGFNPTRRLSPASGAAPVRSGVPAAPAPLVAANPYGVLFDPGFAAGSAQFSAAERPSAGANAPPVPPIRSAALPAPESVPLAPPKPAVSALAESMPLPPPRPAEIAAPANPPITLRRLAHSGRAAVPVAAAAPDNRSFFEKIFGVAKPSAPVLAYASAEGGLSGVAHGEASGPSIEGRHQDGGLLGAAHGEASGPTARYDRWTAVYDLAAHTVYLPDGTRLEAHSGLGDRLDDPNHVDERNRGATPPHVYELEPREELFHGVQALRLNPVGGGDVFGRAGLLAHSYMLGPNGDSNGCVSFRNYEAFLQAFQSGQVKRLAVVARLD